MPKEVMERSKCMVCGKYCGENTKTQVMPLKYYDCSGKLVGIKPTKVNLCNECSNKYVDLIYKFSHLIYTVKGVEK